jgi:hypothetical protein
MCVALIGGMDRLERDYENEAERHGVDLRVFTKSRAGLATRLKSVDAMVVFTGKTSHRIKNEAIGAAKANNIPVLMRHSCGVCSLRECLRRLVGQPDAGHMPCLAASATAIDRQGEVG